MELPLAETRVCGEGMKVCREGMRVCRWPAMLDTGCLSDIQVFRGLLQRGAKEEVYSWKKKWGSKFLSVTAEPLSMPTPGSVTLGKILHL